MIEYLDQKLYTEKELLKEVNKEVKGSNLDSKMLSYFRDVKKIVPRPIRIKVKKGRSGSNAFYTEETVKFVKEIATWCYTAGNELNKFVERHQEDIDDILIKVDIFNNKLRNFVEQLKPYAAILNKGTDSKNLPILVQAQKVLIPEYIKFKLKELSQDVQKAIKENKSENEIDGLLDDFVYLYNQRLVYRMKEKVAEEVSNRVEKNT
ncbi:MAG: hypothetical protein WCQ47_03005 [bacterium]